MDPTIEYMDKFPRFQKPHHRSEFSSADLLALSLGLACLAVSVALVSFYSSQATNTAISVVITLVLTLGAAFSLRGALARGNASRPQDDADMSGLVVQFPAAEGDDASESTRSSRAA